MPNAEFITTECLQAWTSGDFDNASSLIAEDISFVGPFGAAQGADAYMSGLRRFRQRGVQSVEVRKVFSDGDDVCIIYDLITNTAAGTIPAPGGIKSTTARSPQCTRSLTPVRLPNRCGTRSGPAARELVSRVSISGSGYGTSRPSEYVGECATRHPLRSDRCAVACMQG